MTRLAIVTSHPIQYYAPWFRHLASEAGIDLRVFYLWDFGAKESTDPQFQRTFAWDIPLLEGYAHEFVPNVSASPGTSSFRGLDNPALAERVSSFAPDAVLLMCYNYAAIIRFLMKWDRRRAPLLFRGDSHRLVPRTGLGARLRSALIASFYRRVAGLLYVGKANRDYYTQHGVAPEKLFFCPHAVDNAYFQASEAGARVEASQWRRELGVPDGHRLVAFAGKFIEKKRPLDLLHAFQRAEADRASLLFVGAGPLDEELKRQAKQSPNVFFADFQNQSRMPRVYAAADVFVLPSFGSGETWGLAINEAMCLGVPAIVSSHVGCAQDLIEPGANGLVFEAGNVDSLASALANALSDDTRLRRWGARCREVVARYSYEAATNGLRQALDHVQPGVGHR